MLGHGIQRVLHPLEHREQVVGIGRLIAHPARHDDLMPLIDGQLRVVGLHKSVSTDHDAALGVG
ncbi:MAG: hypothetical protein ACI9DC_005156 [Gammaproteobacteria bacterium]